MKKQTLKTQIKTIKKYTRATLSRYRYRHSIQVAKTAKQLARRYKLSTASQLQTYLAGLAHDMCKEESDDFLLATAAQDGMALSSFDTAHPALLHGRAAAVLLQQRFTITDSNILEAVAHHTLGCEYPCTLTKLVMIADKIEPGRKHAKEIRKKVKQLALDQALLLVLEESNNYLRASGKTLHPETKKMYQHLIERRKAHEKRK